MADEISFTNKLDSLLPAEKMRDSKNKNVLKERLKRQERKRIEKDNEDRLTKKNEEIEEAEESRPGKILDIIV